MLEIITLRSGKIILELLERDYTAVSKAGLENPINASILTKKSKPKSHG